MLNSKPAVGPAVPTAKVAPEADKIGTACPTGYSGGQWSIGNGEGQLVYATYSKPAVGPAVPTAKVAPGADKVGTAGPTGYSGQWSIGNGEWWRPNSPLTIHHSPLTIHHIHHLIPNY
jgi:hypothetical protein